LKTLLWFIVIATVLLPLAPFGLRAYITWRYEGRHYSLAQIPPQPIAIVFGAQVRSNGRLSHMLADRVRAGADLYHTGKVSQLLMSGDHATRYYNEPDAMRRFAIELGVPPEVILVDYGGLRTYDTCYRAQALYDIQAAILVTQEFHLNRALWICNALGVEAVGLAADYQSPRGYSERVMRWMGWRELAATSAAGWDILRRPMPRLGLGQPVHLGEAQ
jgi:SanA protein